MASDDLKSIPREEPGVYCMFDLDGEPAYAGRSGTDLRRRLREHFHQQNSSVVSYGRLDIWDIHRIEWWEVEETEQAEQLLLSFHEPYLNFDTELESSSKSDLIDISVPDGVLELLTEDELEFRSEPYNRTKQKLEHLMRMIDKIRFAGHSKKTRRIVYQHQRILLENLSEFLGVENPEELEEASG